MKYDHMYNVLFSIESNNDHENVTIDELIAGVEKRLLELKDERDTESYEFFDSYEI